MITNEVVLKTIKPKAELSMIMLKIPKSNNLGSFKYQRM